MKKRVKVDGDKLDVKWFIGIFLKFALFDLLLVNFTMSRGALILIEGLDRAGKTTQTGKLVDKLKSNGRDVELIKFPGMSF